jgi:hypothetical protein
MYVNKSAARVHGRDGVRFDKYDDNDNDDDNNDNIEHDDDNWRRRVLRIQQQRIRRIVSL